MIAQRPDGLAEQLVRLDFVVGVRRHQVLEVERERWPAALARNLSGLWYQLTPISLLRLREEFRKQGLRGQDREITAAINRAFQQKVDVVDEMLEPTTERILDRLKSLEG